jgi:multidrug efflux system membrane fusion protein
MKIRHFGILFILLIVAAAVYRMFFSFGGMPMGMGGPGGGAMPAAVASVIQKDVDIWNEFSGRLEAVDKVEIRPQVSGTIQKILFQEGAFVQKGAPLFIIDQRPYLADLKRAEANVLAAQTQAEFSGTELQRAASLVQQKVISQSTYDQKMSTSQSASSNLKSAEAALALAKLNVEYSTIRAPISGKISRAEVTEGNLVTIGTPVLASIVSIDPIYGEFNIDEQTYIKFVDVSNTDISMVEKIPVQIVLAGENAPTVNGFMKSFDNKLDTNSGTIRARAVFDNKDGKLIPGLFAKVRLGSTDKKTAVLITDRAIGTDQDKKFVLIVNAENKVEYRPVTLGSSVEGLRVIESGLNGDEKIIVSGLFKYRPEMQVIPQEVPMSGTEPMAQDVHETSPNKDSQEINSGAGTEEKK